MTARRTLPLALLRDVTTRPSTQARSNRAPVPWSTASLGNGKAAILDASGHTIFSQCDGAIARRIVADVNLAECAYRDQLPEAR